MGFASVQFSLSNLYCQITCLVGGPMGGLVLLCFVCHIVIVVFLRYRHIMFLKIDMFSCHNHAEDKINVNMKILSRSPYGSYIIFQYNKVTYSHAQTPNQQEYIL